MRSFFDLIFKTLSSEPNLQNGCPFCASNQEIGFAWSRSVYKNSIHKIKDLRFDESLFQCQECKSYWLLQNDYMKKVNNINLIDRWSEKEYVCPESFLEVLHKIGKTNFLSFPCAGTLKTGEFLPACEFHFLEESPVWLEEKRRIIFVDELESIAESEYALPQKIREKTAEAWEIRMGFAATAIKAPNEQIYLLHGIKNFFFQDGIKGNEIKEIVPSFDEASAKVAHYEGPEPAIVIADLEKKLMIW